MSYIVKHSNDGYTAYCKAVELILLLDIKLGKKEYLEY